MNRVGAFCQLHADMLVVVRPCGICGEAHRGTLTVKSLLDTGVDATGERKVWPEAWQVMPPLPCHPGMPWGIVPEMVQLGMIYEPELN